MKQKTNFSWRGIAFSIAAVLLAFLSIFVLLVGETFQKWLQRSYETENRRAVQTWSAMMEDRLDTYGSYIEEVAKTLYTSGVQFRKGTPPMDFQTRKTCAEIMNTKISGAAGLDVLFILSDDSDAPIITARDNLSSATLSEKLLGIKRYLNVENYPTQSILDRYWQLVLAVQEGNTAPIWGSTLRLLLLAGVCCILLLLVLVYVLYRMVSVPVLEMLEATERVKAGDLTYQMRENWDSREFNTLSASFNAMVISAHQARLELRAREKQKRQDELTMLRAQIQPHFFLNAITTVSNMTYQNRNEEIRQYIAALAKFMRYMLNLQCKQVLVTEELAHIDNYLKMQAIRFPNSVCVETRMDPGAENLEIPYLLLFTVVENTFKHAMNLYSTLKLRIRCEPADEPGFHGWRISVQDNGQGFSQEALARIRSTAVPENPKEHLGLTNVRRTLMLTYGRSDLLHLSNLPEGGAMVEILIPEAEKGVLQR